MIWNLMLYIPAFIGGAAVVYEDDAPTTGFKSYHYMYAEFGNYVLRYLVFMISLNMFWKFCYLMERAHWNLDPHDMTKELVYGGLI
jgi:hypothetical protein